MSVRLSVVVALAVLAIARQGVFATLYSRPSCKALCTEPSDFIERLPESTGPTSGENRPYAWSILALIQTKLNVQDLSPPSAARVIAIVSSCLYEAVAITTDGFESSVGNAKLPYVAYNADAHTAVLDGAGFWALYQIFGERPSFHRVLTQYASFSGEDATGLFSKMVYSRRGYSGYGKKSGGYTVYQSTDRSFFAGQGALACQAVIDQYTADGFRPDGGLEYGVDPTGYTPVNLPQARAGITDCENEIVDLNKWQPLCIPPTDAEFGTPFCRPQEFLYSWAGRFKPFALKEGDEKHGKSLADKPPRARSAEFDAQCKEILDISGTLDDKAKSFAEYWADGPDTTQPPGHFYRIAADAAVSEGLSDAESAKLLFIVGNALYDAGIASWRTKTSYDYVRPLTAIQCGQFRGQETPAWKGPYQGVGIVNVSEWRPYQAPDFMTPAFSAYVSGHSTFSAAASEAMRLYFGDDTYRGPHCDIVREGESLFEPKSNAVPGLTDVPNNGFDTPGYAPAEDVILCWNTFTEASDESGSSRFYGGIHIRADDVAGQALGRTIGNAVYQKTKQLH